MRCPRIHLTAIPITSEEKCILIKKIDHLGGCVLDPQHNQYNTLCTHVVVYDDATKPTERVLAALAAGKWIVRLSWVKSSVMCGYWLPEQPYECNVGHGLPRYHRLRAEAARSSSEASSCILPGGTKAEVTAESGGIFTGWTICIHVQKSSINRSFRRVLAAGDAVVVKACDLDTPGVKERLNLVLTDDASYLMMRELLGSGTPVARHIFLRDILLQKVDPANVARYLYPHDFIPRIPQFVSSNQPVVIDIVNSGCAASVKTTPHHSACPPSSKRPTGTLRRRTRQNTTGTDKLQHINYNRSITDYFISQRHPIKVQDIVVILDDDESDNTVEGCDAEVKQEPINGRQLGGIIGVNDNSKTSDVIVLNDSLELSSESCTKKLKVDENPVHNRIQNLNRCSVDSEGVSDDLVISLELDSNDDIEVVSQNKPTPPAPPSEALSVSSCEQQHNDLGCVAIEDDCYITRVTSVTTTSTAKQTEAVHKAIVAADDDDCCIMDVVPVKKCKNTRVYKWIVKHENGVSIIPNLPIKSRVVSSTDVIDLDVEHILAPVTEQSTSTSLAILSESLKKSILNHDPQMAALTNGVCLSHLENAGIGNTAVSKFLSQTSACTPASDSATPNSADCVKGTTLSVDNLLLQDKDSTFGCTVASVPTVKLQSDVKLKCSILDSQESAEKYKLTSNRTVNDDIDSKLFNDCKKDVNLYDRKDVNSIDSKVGVFHEAESKSDMLLDNLHSPFLNGPEALKRETLNASNSKISQSSTLHIIGRFLELRSSFVETFSGNLTRGICPSLLPEQLQSHFRELTKSETGLYWSSVRSTGLLGIDVNTLNSLSVTGCIRQPSSGSKVTARACNHTRLTVTGSCVNCHASVGTADENATENPSEVVNKGGEGRGSIVDENDVEVVLNSLLWLKLSLTLLHYPNSELVGDMLARYVLKCGVPMVQSEALSVAQHLLSIRSVAGSAGARPYYSQILTAMAATARDNNDRVPLGDTVWVIFDSVHEMLGTTASDASELALGCADSSDSDNRDEPPSKVDAAAASPVATPRAVSYERWQYEQHLLDLLAFVLAVLERDMAGWRLQMCPIEETLSYRLLLGYSNNPAVLPKTAIKFVRLWVSLAPDHATPSLHTRLRHLITQVVGFILELVWLWHCQRQSNADRAPNTPSKLPCSESLRGPGDVHLTDCMAAEDVRFAPLATELVLALRGTPVEKTLALSRELPLSRHRFFIASIVAGNSINTPATSYSRNDSITDKMESSDVGVLHCLVNHLISLCSSCPSTKVAATTTTSTTNDCSKNIIELEQHVCLVQLILLRLQTYLQLTGAVYIVKKAVKETMKRKKSLSVSGNKSGAVAPNGELSTSSASSNQFAHSLNNSSSSISDLSSSTTDDHIKKRKSPENDRESNAAKKDSILLGPPEYFDLFGSMFTRAYLNEYYKRFSTDRKTLMTLHNSLSKLSCSCTHINAVRMLMALLYLK